MKRVDPIQIDEIMDVFVKRLGLKNGLTKVKVSQAWDECVGVNVSRMTIKKYFRESDSVYFVTMSSSVLANQLRFKSKDILTQMNDILGGELVKKLVIR